MFFDKLHRSTQICDKLTTSDFEVPNLTVRYFAPGHGFLLLTQLYHATARWQKSVKANNRPQHYTDARVLTSSESVYQCKPRQSDSEQFLVSDCSVVI